MLCSSAKCWTSLDRHLWCAHYNCRGAVSPSVHPCADQKPLATVWRRFVSSRHFCWHGTCSRGCRCWCSWSSGGEMTCRWSRMVVCQTCQRCSIQWWWCAPCSAYGLRVVWWQASCRLAYGRKAQFRPCCICQQVHTSPRLCGCVARTPRWSPCPQHHSRQIDGATVSDVVAWIWPTIHSRTRILARQDATSLRIGQPSGGSSPRWCWY